MATCSTVVPGLTNFLNMPICSPCSSTSSTPTANTGGRRDRRRSSRARTAPVRSGAGGNSSSAPSATSARSSSVIRLPQPFERTRGARLDRPLWHVERLGDLLLREPEEVAQRHDRPLVVRQLVHRGEQLSTLLRRLEGRLGGRGRAPRGLLGRRAQREVRAPPRSADAVARLVGDDAQKPGPKRRAVTEAPERAPCLDEPVLRGLLRLGGVACDHVRSAK